MRTVFFLLGIALLEGCAMQSSWSASSAGKVPLAGRYNTSAKPGIAQDVRPGGNSPPGLSVLYAFQGYSDGAFPAQPLLSEQDGAFLGVTSSGGYGYCYEGGGCGTVYEFAPSGPCCVERVLYSFLGGEHDGSIPSSGVIRDAKGNLYGTTLSGGSKAYRDTGAGTVFELSPSGGAYVEKILHHFTDKRDGSQPSGLIADEKGSLFGTASSGGNVAKCDGTGCGTVFELTPTGFETYHFSVIHTFQGGADGGYPNAGLVIDKHGNLYVQTQLGGRGADGAVFKLTRQGDSYVESTIFEFDGTNGSSPNALLADDAGALYGTTTYGGAHFEGTAFKLVPDGNRYVESFRYDFKSVNDAIEPLGPLVAGKDGSLYGVGEGGKGRVCARFGCGTVFKLMPSGTGYRESVIYSNEDNTGLCCPGTLAIDPHGTIYGTIGSGVGPYSDGVIFKLTQ